VVKNTKKTILAIERGIFDYARMVLRTPILLGPRCEGNKR
jgi:hypothetical protein